jgi:hypothetical protein
VLVLGPVIPDEQQVSPSTVDTRSSSPQETSGALINSAHTNDRRARHPIQQYRLLTTGKGHDLTAGLHASRAPEVLTRQRLPGRV